MHIQTKQGQFLCYGAIKFYNGSIVFTEYRKGAMVPQTIAITDVLFITYV